MSKTISPLKLKKRSFFFVSYQEQFTKFSILGHYASLFYIHILPRAKFITCKTHNSRNSPDDETQSDRPRILENSRW